MSLSWMKNVYSCLIPCMLLNCDNYTGYFYKSGKYLMLRRKMIRKFSKLHILLLTFVCLLGVIFIKQLYDTHDLDDGSELPVNRHLKSSYVYAADHQNDVNVMNQEAARPPKEFVTFDREVPLIWVGGVPRSGTTLARAMLDAHPDIRCGEETRVIPRILGMHTSMMKSQLESQRLSEAKITKEVLNDALGAYLLSIIAKHGEKAPRLCNKDPFTLRSMNKILEIFPNSKFILMVRDGRATAHSIISRKVTIRGFDTKSYRGCLTDWNRAIEHMFTQCNQAGPSVCLPVQYEDLVLHPKKAMEKVLKFLDVKWDDWVLHHEQTIGKEKGVSLSRRELSTDQVNKPVNTAALTKWVGHIPPDVIHDMDSIAPMLRRLGYDPEGNPPNYGEPDELVAKQSANLDLSEKHERAMKSQQGISDKNLQTGS